MKAPKLSCYVAGISNDDKRGGVLHMTLTQLTAPPWS